MAFNLSEYAIYTVNIYDCEDHIYNRLIDDLDFYMLNTKEKIKYLYYFIYKDVFYIVTKKSTSWDSEKIDFLVDNCLKNSKYFFTGIQSYRGVMEQSFWVNLKRSVEYYDNTDSTRKVIVEELKMITRKRKLEKLLDNLEDK